MWVLIFENFDIIEMSSHNILKNYSLRSKHGQFLYVFDLIYVCTFILYKKYN